MERFDFFFGLHLGGRLHSHTDNLSKDLKGTKVAAVSGQGLTLAYTISEVMKDRDFHHRKAVKTNSAFHWARYRMLFYTFS